MTEAIITERTHDGHDLLRVIELVPGDRCVLRGGIDSGDMGGGADITLRKELGRRTPPDYTLDQAARGQLAEAQGAVPGEGLAPDAAGERPLAASARQHECR